MTIFLDPPEIQPLPLRLVRRTAELLSTPLLPQDFLDLLSPLNNPAVLRGRVLAVEPETADTATVHLKVGRNFPVHRAGQYVRFGIDVDGTRLWRTYSITSPPHRRGRLAVTVKAVPGGAVSTRLVRGLRPGTLVHLDAPAGDFTLPPVLPGRLLLVTAGSGITPVIAMLRAHLVDLRDVVLVHSARSADEVIFGAELRDWARRGRLTLIEHHTAEQPRLTAARLAELVPDLAQRPTFACGPAGLLDELTAYYTAAGLAGQLHTERFTVAATAIGTGGTVRFGRTGRTERADGATTLLDAGERAGVLMPSGCRMGVCFGCVVPLHDGAVRDIRNGAITTAAPGDGVLVQTCISTAAGDCHLDV